MSQPSSRTFASHNSGLTHTKYSAPASEDIYAAEAHPKRRRLSYKKCFQTWHCSPFRSLRAVQVASKYANVMPNSQGLIKYFSSNQLLDRWLCSKSRSAERGRLRAQSENASSLCQMPFKGTQ